MQDFLPPHKGILTGVISSGKSRRRAGGQRKLQIWKLVAAVQNPSNAPCEVADLETLTVQPFCPDLRVCLRDTDKGNLSLGLGPPPHMKQASHPANTDLPVAYQDLNTICFTEPHFLDSLEPLIQIERVWTGRLDPFFPYPIEMNARSLKLVNHRMQAPRTGMFLVVC